MFMSKNVINSRWRDNMRYRRSYRYLLVILSITLVVGCVSAYAETKQQPESKQTSKVEVVSLTNEMLSNNYTMVSSRYKTNMYDGAKIELPINTVYSGGSGSALTSNNHNYKNDVVDIKLGETALLTIKAPKAAQYLISFDYLSNSDSILPVEFSMKLNGEIPFYEARRLEFDSTWVYAQSTTLDRYGNEIVTMPEKLIQWENEYLMDASYRYSTPLSFELKEGDNTIEINVTEGSLLLGNIYLTGDIDIPSYVKAEAADGEELIIIEAEKMDSSNDSSIRPVAEYDTALTPYTTSTKVLNVIDSASFHEAGQRLTYKFDVEKEGYYYIAFAYRQPNKTDFPVFCDIRIDGNIPNTLLKAYPFDYAKEYRNLTLSDEMKDPIAVYLTEGEHTLSITINNDNIRHVMEAVDRIMSEVNDLALEITKVAGTNKDKYRDLKLMRYIPDVQDRLYGWVDELNSLRDSIKIYNPGVKEIGAFSSLSIAASKLKALAKDPDEIPYRINELAQSTSSVIQYLANLVDSMNRNDLALDKIFIYQKDADIPKGVGFFKGIYLNIVRFLSSFSDQSYSTANVNKEHLQVWVNRPRQHIEIMQRLVDEKFTPETGIKVDISVMPDQNKLILANASGDAPDVAASINYSIPFELGIRGAIKDLTEFDDYREILTRFTDGLHIPAVIGDGIYAIPETINFWVLYYRTDIMDKLGLEIPNTIDDVKELLPELQMRGLNFYYPTAGMSGLKTFHGTTPLLFQYGAKLYGETAGDTTINSDQAIKGFTELTELFTIYNLPSDVPSFYQHFRNGYIPIGIAEYNMYNLLLNAAPEIANSWDIAPIPGIVGDDGEVLRYSSGGAESCVIFNKTPEREQMAWDYLKWWTSTEIQVEFGQTLQNTYGSEYIWNTANVEAFQLLPWKSEDKKIIAEQTQWILEAPRILGTYMLERELSNAYTEVVINGKDLRLSIDTAVKRINRETERKLMEFGYLSQDGEVIEEYMVPDLELVRTILYGE